MNIYFDFCDLTSAPGPNVMYDGSQIYMYTASAVMVVGVITLIAGVVVCYKAKQRGKVFI
jgi:hypothetical protein